MTTDSVDPGPRDDAIIHLVRRLAVAVVAPAGATLVIGLLRAAGGGLSPTPDAMDAPTVPLHELTMPDKLMSPWGVLTAGLAMLAVLPALTLIAIAVALLSRRRWREALLTCGVLAMLGLAACLGHR